MEDLATTAELVCSKCKRFPCTCVPDILAKRALIEGDVCAICRRNRLVCLCKSHAAVQPVSDETEARAPVKRHNAKTIEAAVNEIMHHYYNRDPAAIARYVRGLLR